MKDTPYVDLRASIGWSVHCEYCDENGRHRNICTVREIILTKTAVG